MISFLGLLQTQLKISVYHLQYFDIFTTVEECDCDHFGMAQSDHNNR